MFIVGIGSVSAEDMDDGNVLSANDIDDAISADETSYDINENDLLSDNSDNNAENKGNNDIITSDSNDGGDGYGDGNADNAPLGSGADEILADDLDITIVDPSNFTTATFNTHHDVYYLPDGTYTVSSIVNIGGQTAATAQSNFVVRGDANTIISINTGYINLVRGTNCILENLKFTQIEGKTTNNILLFGANANNVTIRNCTFENITSRSFVIGANGLSNANDIKIENCSFINCEASNVLAFLKSGKTVALSGNVFENCAGTLMNVTADILSEVSFNVTSKSIASAGSDIQGKLVDDNGNAIYSPNLKFLVNGEEMAPTFDKGSGLYSLSYVPSGNEEVSVSASCSNAHNLNAETAYLSVVSSSNLSFEALFSEYLYQTVYVNATLNEAITNENITFIIRNPQGVLVESVDKIITNGFAEASIVLNASSPGNYSAYAIYGGSNRFAAATAFEKFYAFKSGVQANITPDDYSAFALAYDIYYFPDGTYTINKETVVGGTSSNSYSNFILRGGNNAIISFDGDVHYTGISCGSGENVTFENLKFTAVKDLSESYQGVIRITGRDYITFKNCSFENITNTNNIIRIYNCNANIIIENCSFINCTSSNVISHESTGSISLSGCIFENCSGAPLSITKGAIAEADFNCIINNVTSSGSYIIGELVDSDGNAIYSPNLKFIINDEEKTPSFDKKTGLYSFWYVPTESQVSVRAVCSNVQTLNVETSYLPILASPELSINSTQSITYGEELIIVNATLNETITNENVTFTLKDSSGNIIKSVDALITDGFANSSFVEKLLPGTYTISVIYKGDEEFGEGSASAQLTVNKLTGYINVTANNVTVFDDVIVTFTMPEEVSGSFELIKIGNSNTNSVASRENVNVVDGKVTINFGPLAARDDYCIMYSFNSQNALYSSINNHGYWMSNRNLLPQFKVLKVDSIPIIDVNDICLGDNATISVSGLAETATGTVTYYVDDGEAVVKNIGETFTVEGLGVGEHNVRVVYSGDENYSANETSATFNVFTIALESYDLDYDENVAVVAVLPDGAEGMLGIEVDGIDPVSAQVVNGSAAFELSGLKPGNYTLHMAYQGTPIDLHADVDVTVIPKITNVDDLNTVDNAIGIDLPSDATGSLTVTVDGNTTIVVPVENGTAKCSIENLTAGDHEITVAYEGNYPSYSSTQTVSVAKGTPQTSVDAPSSITAGQSVTVPINLPSDATGVVLVDVDGKKYYADVIDGVANVNVAGLSAGDKVLAYRYLGDDKYAEISGSATLKVVAPKVAPKVADKISLALKKVTVKKSAKKLVIKATLKINGKAVKGKKVTFKFKGKKYTAKTNAKGIAKITVKKAVLKKLKVGKKVKYTATYGKKTAKKTVKVKK